MLKIKYNWMFFLGVFITPFMVISINSWFSMWINMELNLMMFIGLMIMNNFNIYESPMKYFLINSFSSSLFIFLINCSKLNYINYVSLMMILILSIKLGVVPFHYWFIDMMMNLNWFNCFILSTWQKIIPFMLMMSLFNKNINMLILLIIMISGKVSIIFGMNQINLKKIMSYSSINHMCWMLFSLMVSEIMWLVYFINYLLLNFILMKLFNLMNLNNLMDFFKLLNKKLKFVMSLVLLSLGGLPPFLGFILKWLSIFSFLQSLNYFMVLSLIFYSLMYLYNYIRLMINLLLMNYKNLKNYTYKMNILKPYNLSSINLWILFSIMNLFMINFWFFY